MLKTLCFQLLLLLALTSWNPAGAKSLEESDDAILTITKRDERGQEEEYEEVKKRDPEEQEEDEEEDYEEEEKRDSEDQEEEEYEDEEEEYVDEEKRDSEDEEEEEYEEEEEFQKRDSEEKEEQYEDEEKVEKRDPENEEEESEDEEKIKKRDPEEQEQDFESEQKIEKRDPEEEEEDSEDEEKVKKRDPEEEAREEAVSEEKREDTVESESETSSQVEDLKTRAVQARFTLVDYRGRRINGQREGLLLYNGGTVCDDLFNWNSAHAVCRTMGYTSATRYRSGLRYGTFQSRKRIGLDNVRCTSTHWAACTSTPNHNCNHHEDILLTCRGTGFKLINRYGHAVGGNRMGLLTYQGGTVCDDYFSWNSAHAICRVMGYASARSWRHGRLYGVQQTHRRIVMDDVRCRYSWWNYCSYRMSHNCGHHEDVFLTCRPGRTHPVYRNPGFRLVDWRGGTAARGCEGLLLSHGGTVCDDYFNSNAAHAVCKMLGYPRGALRYRNGLAYGTMQSRKRISMDNVRCRSTTWSTCRYSTRHNCSHGEDILLTCRR